MHKNILTATNKKSQSNKGRHQTQQALYGICHKCKSSIEIPGLEAFKCSGECGWVRHRAARTNDLHRPVQVIRIAPVHKTEVSLLDLVGQGGVR